LIYRIKKGNHRAWPPVFGILSGNVIERIVEFNRTNSYELRNADDSLDVNKLFGFGYLWSHHNNSARWGWNYNVETNRIRLYAYCYNKKIRSMDYVCEVSKNLKVNLKIELLPDHYRFTASDAANRWHVFGEISVPYGHNKKFKYLLGCYFGGNNPAPHNMNILIKKR
jgi:hypothetical protein